MKWIKKCLFPQEGHSLAGDGSEHSGAEAGKPEQLPQLAVGGCKGTHRKDFCQKYPSVWSSKLRRPEWIK